VKAPAAEGVPAAPPDGGYVEVTPGILWLRLPIPGALRHINVWLVPGERGWLLVDTGMHEAGVLAAWESLHANLPLDRDLEGIVVTHHHPDHLGMAAALSERHGVPVYCSERSRQAAAHVLAPAAADHEPEFASFADRHGLVLDDALRQLLAWNVYSRIVSGMPVGTRELVEGQALSTRQTERGPPKRRVMRIIRVSWSTALWRAAGSGWVKSGEQQSIGMTNPADWMASPTESM